MLYIVGMSVDDSGCLDLPIVKKHISSCREVFPEVEFGNIKVPSYPTGSLGFVVSSKQRVSWRDGWWSVAAGVIEQTGEGVEQCMSMDCFVFYYLPTHRAIDHHSHREHSLRPKWRRWDCATTTQTCTRQHSPYHSSSAMLSAHNDAIVSRPNLSTEE